ncbi:MAG: VCBS repeat-containing protein, partial [Myxococcota bacterium]|nr:VCBS repeat-containing protein [Myxococcota bacterium]
MRSRYWLWALALFLVACGDTQTTRPDTTGDSTELADQDVEPTDLGDFDGSDGSDESPNDQDADDGTDEGDDGVDPDGLDQEQPCPSDRLCGGGCCEAPSVCYLGQCRDTCSTGVTCGESAGLCCPSGEGCRPDGSCGLVCEDERPTCGEGIWETCCAPGEVCNNERCSKDCGENVLCGELCCSGGQMCYDGACVASCADPGQLCGAERELCCPNDEVCLGGTTCIEPGKPCQLTEECELDEYCEPTLQACVPRTLVEVCEYRPPIGVFNPLRGCLWTAPNDARPPACGTSTDGLLSAMSDVVMTPSVANLTDDNGDGVTDENDIPDIVFTSFNYAIHGCCDKGVIRIVDGRCNPDGSMNTIATLDQVWIDNSGGIALGNLDPASEVDERNPEIVAVFRLGGTIAYKRASSDGSAWVEMWRNSSYLNNTYTRGGTQPSLADLNGDGAPEVLIGNVVLNGQTGELIWDGKLTVGATAGVGNNAFLGPMSTAADLDLDGLPEVIAGNTVYDGLTGAEKWTYTYTSNASSCGGAISCDGYSAVGNFDPDPEGEVVIVRLGEVFVLEHNGALKHKVVLPKDDCGANESGPPTIADFDGDLRPEIGTAGADYYIVVDFDCVGDPLPEECHAPNIRWVAPNNDCS